MTARRQFIAPSFDALGVANERNEAHEWSVCVEHIAVCDLVTNVQALLEAERRLNFLLRRHTPEALLRTVDGGGEDPRHARENTALSVIKLFSRLDKRDQALKQGNSVGWTAANIE